MQMRRLWELVTRRLCTYVESDDPNAYDPRDATDGTDRVSGASPSPFALGCRNAESNGRSDAALPTGSHEDALLRFVVDTFPLDNVTWQTYYLSVAGVGLAFFLAQLLHVGVVSRLDPVLPTIALMGLLSLGGLYQLYTRVVYVAPPP